MRFPILLLLVGTPTFAQNPLAEGGRSTGTALKQVRVHSSPRLERWNFAFAGRGQLPRYQVHTVSAREHEERVGSIRLFVRFLQTHPLTVSYRENLVEQSKWVQEIVAYPSIEDGDTAFELVLSPQAPLLEVRVEETAQGLAMTLQPKAS